MENYADRLCSESYVVTQTTTSEDASKSLISPPRNTEPTRILIAQTDASDLN